MSCHDNQGNKSAINLARRATGLTRKEVEKAFHDLKTEGGKADAPAPTRDEWENHLHKQKQLTGILLSSKDQPLVREGIAGAYEEAPPAGGSFYAHQRLTAECHLRRMRADGVPDNSKEEIDQRMWEREQYDRQGMGEDAGGSVLFTNAEHAEMMADPITYGLVLPCGCKPESRCQGECQEYLNDYDYDESAEDDTPAPVRAGFSAGDRDLEEQGEGNPNDFSWTSESQDEQAGQPRDPWVESPGATDPKRVFGAQGSVWDDDPPF